EVDRLKEDLTSFQAVCLLNVADPKPGLWALLERYVNRGGGLIVIPGGSELRPDAYNEDETAKKLLPGQLVKVITAPDDAPVDWNWDDPIYRHPLLRPYQEDRRRDSTDFVRLPRGAKNYWEVTPDRDRGVVLVRYADAEKRPAILESSNRA